MYALSVSQPLKHTNVEAVIGLMGQNSAHNTLKKDYRLNEMYYYVPSTNGP